MSLLNSIDDNALGANRFILRDTLASLGLGPTTHSVGNSKCEFSVNLCELNGERSSRGLLIGPLNRDGCSDINWL